MSAWAAPTWRRVLTARYMPQPGARPADAATRTWRCCRPGKKPFSSMSPLIAERGGAFQLAIGASGGPRIISAVLQATVRWVRPCRLVERRGSCHVYVSECWSTLPLLTPALLPVPQAAWIWRGPVCCRRQPPSAPPAGAQLAVSVTALFAAQPALRSTWVSAAAFCSCFVVLPVRRYMEDWNATNVHFAYHAGMGKASAGLLAGSWQCWRACSTSSAAPPVSCGQR